MKKSVIYGKRIAAVLFASMLAAASVPVHAGDIFEEVTASAVQETTEPVMLHLGENQDEPETDTGGGTEKKIPPQIKITRERISGSIEGGKNFETNLIIDNSSQDYPLQDVKLTLEGSGEMVLREPTNVITLGTIKANEQRNCRVRLKTEQLLTSSAQTMMATLEYSYESEEGLKRESIQTEIIFPTVPSEDDAENSQEPTDVGAGDLDSGGYSDGGSSDSSGSSDPEKKTLDVATPNVIVSRYDYGGQVEAGQEFMLHLELKNTSSQTAVGNMIMAVETGESLAITNASNSTYIENINPQETVSIEIPMKALADGKPEGSRLEISFKYEFVAKETRTQATSTEKIAIPVIQPDKYIVSEAVLENEIHQNTETTISIPYVNKGKGTIYNVEAKLETDDNLEATESYLYLGNLDAGASGTVDFIVNPRKKGNQKAKVRITYEDSSNKQQEIVKEVKMKVQDEAPDESEMYGMGMDEGFAEEPQTAAWKKYALWGGGAGLLLLTAGLIYKKRKKEKSLLLEEDEDDEEDDW